MQGQELIVTSGDSVLGADDKAGVAEIMALCKRLTAPDAPEHCTVCIGFTPDEEIGSGADHFDVAGFGADYAYRWMAARWANWSTRISTPRRAPSRYTA